MPRLTKFLVTTPCTSEKANVQDPEGSNEFARKPGDRRQAARFSYKRPGLLTEKAWGEHVPTADDVANMAPISSCRWRPPSDSNPVIAFHLSFLLGFILLNIKG